jgi:tripartite-type tricarboxylate transporter receptor subunit TctC
MRIIRKIGLAAAMLTGLGTAALGQGYPDGKPITVIIPFTAGGSNDTIGRYLADGLSVKLGVPVVVENVPGAGSAIGSAQVAQSAADGHTLLFVSSTFTTNAATAANLPFDPVNDLAPVGIAALGQMVIVTGPKLGVTDLKGFVEKAKAEGIFYGTTGVGSSTQFAAALFSDVVGLSFEPVHYPGGTDALIDIAGGRLDVYFGTVAQALSQIESGNVTALAVTSATRASALPDVPTVAEAGFAGTEMDNWWGVFAPAGTPPEVLEALNGAITETMTSETAAEFLAKQGAIPVAMDLPEFTTHVGSEIAKWQKLAESHGIKAE